ncbi:hypothetical protein [Streptomyces sp. NPDC086777]|uniref:hypothetical protein n=1 Tax=Streptomyces sp. NPDC086777 TaxID=3154866 RepID=UPI00344B305B
MNETNAGGVRRRSAEIVAGDLMSVARTLRATRTGRTRGNAVPRRTTVPRNVTAPPAGAATLVEPMEYAS